MSDPSPSPRKPVDTITVVPLTGESDEHQLADYKLGMRAIRNVVLGQIDEANPARHMLRDAYAVLTVTANMILEELPPEARRARFASMVEDHAPHLAEFGYEAHIEDDLLIIAPSEVTHA